MPGNFDVTAEDVRDEMPGVAPSVAFSEDTIPKLSKVDEWILRADDYVSLIVQRSTGKFPPDETDAAYRLGRDYVMEFAKGKIKRAVYEGEMPERVDAASAYHFRDAKSILLEIQELGVQATGPAAEGVPSRVRGIEPSPPREMLIDDADLDVGSARQRRW